MSGNGLDQLERLNRLREAGALTNDEFEQQKQAILSGEARPASRRRLLLIGAGLATALGVAAASAYWAGGVEPQDGNALAASDYGSVTAPSAPEAPDENATAAAPLPSSPSELLRFATSDEVIGINPAHLEQRLGVPKEKDEGYLLFDVGACSIYYWSSGSRVEGFALDVGPSCTPTIRGYRVSPSTTFGDLLRNDSSGGFTADCLYNCGNLADPVVDLTYRGSHATNFITVRYAASAYQSFEALELWEQDVRQGLGLSEYEFPPDDAPFNCVSNPSTGVRRIMARMRVASVAVTGGEFSPC